MSESADQPEVVTVEELQNDSPAENTPPPETTPVSDPPVRKPKRLTLQERLALAAKAKEKPVVSPIEPRFDVSAKTSAPEEAVETPEIQDNGAENKNPIIPAASEEELAQLRSQLHDLEEQNRMLKASAALAASTSDLERKIAEKDETIKQLMEEGEALSKKEVKLHERVRSLAQTNTKLEASLKAYSEKNEETQLKLEEVEDIMKVHKLKSVEQIVQVLGDANQRIADLQQSLDQERAANWEAKYRELQKLYEAELSAKKDVLRLRDDVTLQLQMLERQARLDVQSKENLVEQLNREILELQDENAAEISRLEAKMESLRVSQESYLQQVSGGDGADIEYLEYAKLLQNHRNLQEQYVASQENWKIIELNLLSKVDAAALALETLKKAKTKAANETRRLHAQIAAQSDQIAEQKAELAKLSHENKELAFQLQIKASELAETEEKLEELKTVFAADRQAYDAKIEALTEAAEYAEARDAVYGVSMSSDTVSSLQTRRLRDSGLHVSLEARGSRNFSSQSIPGTGTPGQTWDDAPPATPYGIGIGGLGGMPGGPGTARRYSLSLLTEELDTFEAPDSTPDPSFLRDTPNSGATRNIQLIGKMSASIRRLEMELAGLKEENEQIAAEKDAAQQEVVAKYDLEKQVADLQQSISTLEKEVAASGKKEETLLQVIGEKSERVAELQADVEDLKELCRQQVMQMTMDAT